MTNAKLSLAILSASQLYERTRTEPSNRDLFKVRKVDGLEVKRLHYLAPDPWQKETSVTLSLGSRIIGIGGLQVNPHNNDMLWVTHVSVEAKHRGKGYARMIIEAIYAYAVEQGKVVSPSAFSILGQRLKPIFDRMNEQFPAAYSGEAFRDHLH
ncbi:MAG: GNAT family N-acetyltransferase [Candidatus Obscuribacterales bacterium]|jgi:GNAT superfamily N-acetyltransferase